MDSERIQRWTLPRVMFILSFVCIYILFKGNISDLFGNSGEANFENIFALVIAVFSPPIVGLMILDKARALDLSNQLEKFNPKWGFRKKREYKENFYPYYQVLVRRGISSEELRFLERRWTVYWTHINNLAYIFFY